MLSMPSLNDLLAVLLHQIRDPVDFRRAETALLCSRTGSSQNFATVSVACHPALAIMHPKAGPLPSAAKPVRH